MKLKKEIEFTNKTNFIKQNNRNQTEIKSAYRKSNNNTFKSNVTAEPVESISLVIDLKFEVRKRRRFRVGKL